MSIKIMSMVWDDGPNDKAEVLILLAIADFCNDAGECWPAVSTIAGKARMSERGAQKIIARLVDAGWLEVEAGGGRRNCNLYRIKNPEPRSPRTTFTPNPSAKTPNASASNPEPRSPEPSLTIIEPSVNNSAAKPYAILQEWAGTEAVKSFMEYRKRMRKPLSETAARRLASQLQKIFQSGGDTDDALGMAEEKGWQSLQADWYFKAKGNTHGNFNHNGVRPSEGRSHRSDPALEQIARLAGLGGTFRDGGA
jgi:hypothetical protein